MEPGIQWELTNCLKTSIHKDMEDFSVQVVVFYSFSSIQREIQIGSQGWIHMVFKSNCN